MASISKSENGDRRILFLLPSGERRAIRLGDMPEDKSLRFKENLETLLKCRQFNQPEGPAIIQWLAELPDRFYERLAGFEIVTPRKPPEPPKPAGIPLADFIDGYLAKRADLKAGTKLVLGHTRRCLVEYFKNKAMAEITDGDADDFRLWLVSHEDPADKTTVKLSDNTVRRRCGIARQYFKAAMKRGLVTRNPFMEMPVTVRGNRKRMYLLSRADAQKVLDACPDAQWRLLFALARFGGLRIPSEALALRWRDVDWAGGRFTVHASKTEHHDGGGIRQVPIFPELLPYLREVFEEPGASEYVITRYRNPATNLRTQLQRIITAAGLPPWPKLWQNLRATRETELSERWPIKTVCTWIGNSRLVAAEHYLSVPEEHWDQAAADCTQICTQSVPVSAGQDHTTTHRTPAALSDGDTISNALTDVNRTKLEMTGEGGKDGYGRYRIRTGTDSLGFLIGDGECTHFCTQIPQLDNLEAWLDVCPSPLSQEQRAAILAHARGG